MKLGATLLAGALLTLMVVGCRGNERASKNPNGDREPTARAQPADPLDPDSAANLAAEDAERFNPPPGERPPAVRPRIDDRRPARDQPRVRRP
jgi:hypothetical protein